MLQLRDPNTEFRVDSLMRIALADRWQTEAQRSHVRPILLWFTRGQGRMTIGGSTRGFGAHNAIFVPGGTVHSFSMMGQALGSAVFFPEELSRELPDEPLHLRIRDGFQQAELTGLIDALEREASQMRRGSERAMRHLGGLLSVWLERHADNAERPAQPTAAERLATAYSALVERDFRSGRGVSGYAEKLGVTATHLSRVCRQSSGKSAHRMLSDRIHYEARRLLSESDLPINEIARRLGFTSAAYFSRAFQKATGKSPRDFRRSS